MDRAEAEAIYDAGREACVTLLVELTGGYERQIASLEERLCATGGPVASGFAHEFEAALAGSAEITCAAACGGAAKAKELRRREGERRAGGQPGHRGAGRELRPEDQVDEIVDHFRMRAAPAGASSPPGSGARSGGSGATRSLSCHRSA